MAKKGTTYKKTLAAFSRRKGVSPAMAKKCATKAARKAKG